MYKMNFKILCFSNRSLGWTPLQYCLCFVTDKLMLKIAALYMFTDFLITAAKIELCILYDKTSFGDAYITANKKLN